MSFDEILAELHSLANPEKVAFKEKKFGIIAQNSLGIYHSDLKELARKIGKDSELAIRLFETDIFEARILCSKIFMAKDLTKNLAEHWVRTFDNWEICDSFSMGVFAKSNLAIHLINEWNSREPEFEKRSAFAIISAYCMADKKADNSVFLPFLDLIESAATDERLYVKKGVNWALRSIGKRNIDLKDLAIELSMKLLSRENRAANWIAKDALKELQNNKCRMSDYPRAIYRP